MCGGTGGILAVGCGLKGLSPRVRGNLPAIERAIIVLTSIPACAGEPSGRLGQQRPAEVYPRVCGGTSVGISASKYQ